MDEYFVRGRDSNARKQAGAGAFDMAARARAASPVRTALGRVTGVRTDERAWRRGGEGEARLGRALAQLKDNGWHLFHDINVGSRGANIDHLAIGPGGIFTINTKNLSGNVWVASRALLRNGRKTDYLPKARSEGERVRRIFQGLGFGVPVRAVIAIYCEKLTIKEHPEDVVVISASRLPKWLSFRPPVIGPKAVFDLAAVADDPSTWR